jgi:sulfite oxidase
MQSRRLFLQSSAAWTASGYFLRHAAAADDDLIVRTPDPYNAEPALKDLVADRITPANHFYVRNHGRTPKVDASTHKLRIEGLVDKPLELSLADIKDKFHEYTIEATLTCAGNRRQELSAIKAVGGVQWDAGAIGNARWTGASLFDVIRMAEYQRGARHIWFEGLDPIKEKDGSQAPFGGSIPIERAFPSLGAGTGGQRTADLPPPVLIAHAMNDQPLTPEHGAPLRVVVPGYIGARSVKWLTKITLSDRPSPNHYVAEAYKIVKTEDKGELAAADPIYTFGVNAAICIPSAAERLQAGRATIRGYALPSGEPGCTVAKVEISSDGGRNWTPARLSDENHAFTWNLWSAELDLPAGKHELTVRALDSKGKMMPERGEWNLKGYMNNGWHRVIIEVA